jgi:hypothetical protein
MYEPYVASLAAHLAMPLPPWIHARDEVDNWQTSAWERNPRAVARTFESVCRECPDAAVGDAAARDPREPEFSLRIGD